MKNASAVHRTAVFLSEMIVSSMLLNTGALYAETRKDISDPVLQEVVTSFSLRMPRFVDKHGQSIFVSDEPITRSSLMLALYEYDKSLKIPRKDFASKQEIEELRAKLALLEKGETRASQTAAASTGGSKLDITQVINDLQPNMPVLLDNSLNNSRVFASLKEELNNLQAASAVPSQGYSSVSSAEVKLLTQRLDRMERSAGSTVRNQEISTAPGASKKEYDALRQRLDTLEAAISRVAEAKEIRPAATLADRGSVTKKEYDALKRRLDELEAGGSKVPATADAKRLKETQQQLAQLENRISEIENNPSGSGEARQYASTLTRITLGLGMVAAFFVAR
jgi:hypothetical protein